MPKVFISYAKEDRTEAESLHRDLRGEGFDAWIDSQDLLAGSNWATEIRKAIRGSQYFVLLLSQKCMTKRGFVHREIREALAIVRELPETEIFLIPARLEHCEVTHEDLSKLQWVDLFPDWDHGLATIIESLGPRTATPPRSERDVPPRSDRDVVGSVTQLPLEYYKFVFLLARFSRFPTSHGFDRTSLDWMQRITTYDTEPFVASSTVAEEGGFETAALSTILLTRFLGWAKLDYISPFRDSLVNFLRKRRDFNGRFGPLGPVTRSGKSPVMSTSRHTALGVLALSYISDDSRELHQSLDQLIQDYQSSEHAMETLLAASPQIATL